MLLQQPRGGRTPVGGWTPLMGLWLLVVWGRAGLCPCHMPCSSPMARPNDGAPWGRSRLLYDNCASLRSCSRDAKRKESLPAPFHPVTPSYDAIRRAKKRAMSDGNPLPREDGHCAGRQLWGFIPRRFKQFKLLPTYQGYLLTYLCRTQPVILSTSHDKLEAMRLLPRFCCEAAANDTAQIPLALSRISGGGQGGTLEIPLAHPSLARSRNPRLCLIGMHLCLELPLSVARRMNTLDDYHWAAFGCFSPSSCPYLMRQPERTMSGSTRK